MGPLNFVSMRKRGTRCIAPNLRRAHFEGTIILRGALRRLQNSAGQRLTANLSCGVLEPSKCAPRNYGAFKVCPAELWSLQSAPRGVLEQFNVCPAFSWRHSYGGQNTHNNHLKLRFSLFFKGYFCKPLSFQPI